MPSWWKVVPVMVTGERELPTLRVLQQKRKYSYFSFKIRFLCLYLQIGSKFDIMSPFLNGGAVVEDMSGTQFQIAVCDDIQTDREQIAGMAEEILSGEQIPHSIRCYENAKALLTAIQKGAKFNLLLLDVLMDEMDGMALAAELRKQGD